MTNEQISLSLYKQLPLDQVDRVFNTDGYVDIAPEFLGFLLVYKNLADIIPRHFTVVDLGCGYNPQSFLFQKHKKYIAVDNFPDTERFCSLNCTIYELSIKEFIDNHIDSLDLDETFAICSYVPPWGDDNIKLTRHHFKNVFTYYPHGGQKISLSGDK